VGLGVWGFGDGEGGWMDGYYSCKYFIYGWGRLGSDLLMVVVVVVVVVMMMTIGLAS